MTHSLHTLLEHAERERDDAMAALLQAEEAGRRLRQQMEQLQTYHAEYAARSPAQGGRAAPIDQLRGHHAFMQRLDQALAQQQGLLQGADHHVLQARQLLLSRETRVASVRKLAERRALEQQRATDRREQKRSDESATQRHWHDNAHSRTVTH